MSEFCPRILIVTSCTGDKIFKPQHQLQLEDFKSIELLQQRSQQLADYICPAVDLYTGVQHLRLMEGVKLLRESCPNNTIDVVIVSAGYGLISEETIIAPYEVTQFPLDNRERAFGVAVLVQLVGQRVYFQNSQIQMA
jgi:hypothetical protein